MPEFCHRCGGELPAGSGESPFCPHCGTPQLFLALENQSVETGGDPVLRADGSATTGTLPPPRPQQVEWKTAIGCAAVVAGIGSVLCLAAMRVGVLSGVSFLWIMSASLITLAMYQKRRPSAWMDVKVGARIGLVVGICMAVGLGVAVASAGLVARFGLHAMGNFDSQMASMVVQVEKGIQQKSAEQTTPVPAWIPGLLQSPEFRAGYSLFGCAFVSACLLALSAAGGAFAGLLRTRRRPLL